MINDTKCVFAQFVDKQGNRYNKKILFEPKIKFDEIVNQKFLEYFKNENNILYLKKKYYN